MGKWYINKTRSENNPLLFRHFVGLLKLNRDTEMAETKESITVTIIAIYIKVIVFLKLFYSTIYVCSIWMYFVILCTTFMYMYANKKML